MKKLLITSASALLLLTGCSTMSENPIINGSFINKIGASQVEKESVDTVSSKVVKGKTTKSEISKIFGKPTSRSIDSSELEAWTYSDMNFTTNLAGYIPIPTISNIFGHTKAQSKSLIILFNKNDIVENYNFSEDGY